MRTLPIVAVALTCVAWQQRPAPLEQATLRLHYVQKPIGTERYEIARSASDGGLQLSADFDFTDRGGRVQLAATLRTAPDFTPVHFSAKGKSYRFVNVDSEVEIDRAGSARARRRRRGSCGPAGAILHRGRLCAFLSADVDAALLEGSTAGRARS